MQQGWLFGREAAAFDPSFAQLSRAWSDGDAWIDVAPGWVRGHATLFEELRAAAPWREESRQMYDARVAVPRLVAALPPEARPALVDEMRRALERRYGCAFPRVSAALYRDGRDSVAWHGDYVARKLPSALVATVSLGGARRFLVRPTGGGRSQAFSAGQGDLMVMGGSCQRTHQHSIPKVAQAEPRIALMFRPIWEEP